MTLNHYVYIFRGKGMDPKKNRAEIASEELLFIAIAVDQLDQASVSCVANFLRQYPIRSDYFDNQT